MSKFNQYFLMEANDVIEYVQEKVSTFKNSNKLSCKEIGDGNLNYVFRVVDQESGSSIIVKQAGDTARISDEFKLSTNRIRIESNMLQLEGSLAPDLVPIVYYYDDTMNCCVMEDLSDHTILRTALLNYEIFPNLAEDLATFMANTLLLTSDVVMNHQDKKNMVKNYINADLCEITEDLVYSEPFTNYKNRNDLLPENQEWIEQNIYGDKKLRFEAAKLKFDFLTNAQALLHGDLHTGSIFVREHSTKVIDPEFAFYGPMGYDVGNVMANLIFAWAHAEFTLPSSHKKDSYLQWLEGTLTDIIDLFSNKFLTMWKQNVSDIMAKEDDFDRWYLDSVLVDTSGVAGLELIRRIVGLAKVKDITSITDNQLRAQVERVCLLTAKKLIIERTTFKVGTDYVNTLKNEALLGKKVMKND
ncbi:S-methyl-5-thioribose kinase [Neobacillus sp. PS3-40]|uniref:S-methyl-5-thioribose kinase n=1 Tax=Neobacillus sp. PS3-40 TaxID=3070679 RepID=UPI0027E1DF93|nr:S-methyl-5-thioribose kinase [Neobacillus sp. PS3-40]WML44447.1 S-methyl-5-thioribose kinase [Neobacillus sp. PS3-40]